MVRGHTAYSAVPGNIHAVSAFRKQVTQHWGRALRRRSQRHRVTWERMRRLEARWRRLAYYLGEVNALHPFREGNGRAQRAFFRQLARDAGFTLAWQHLDPVRNVEASAAIMCGDPEPMREMLRALIIDGT